MSDGDDYDFDPPPSPKFKRVIQHGAVGTDSGKTIHPNRILIRVVSFRHRLLDEDNLCPKYFIDGCRYSGLVPEDSPEVVSIQTSQQKIPTSEEERTEITIGPLNPHA